MIDLLLSRIDRDAQLLPPHFDQSPVVRRPTRLGAVGYGVRSASEARNALIGLLENEALRAELGGTGRGVVEDRYSG